MDDASARAADDIATQSDCVLTGESVGTSGDSSCLCCTTSAPPVITLATACVHYLRCSACGFIWIVRAPESVSANL